MELFQGEKMTDCLMDTEWIMELARRTGFSVPTIHQLIEVCYFQFPPKNVKTEVLDLIHAIQRPQRWYSLRINPVRLTKKPKNHILDEIRVYFHAHPNIRIPNLIFLPVDGPFNLIKQSREIVIDKFAAESVMIGANLYIPGFQAPLPSFEAGEQFSIYGPNHEHVANGIAQFSNEEILNKKKGVGIQTTESIYRIPSYRDSIYYSSGLISDHSFGPYLACLLLMQFYKENDVIMDVCSAPGHKTCALSEIVFSKFGVFPKIYSIDRSTKRLEALYTDITRLGLQNIQIIPKAIEKLPTYHPELLGTANFLVLDPPCSALGTRPKLAIDHTDEEYRSLFLLQRRIAKEIMPFLSKDAIILYTTCSLSVLENEGIVSILMRDHGLELLDATKILYQFLTEEDEMFLKKEFTRGIFRNEQQIHTTPFMDSVHIVDLDRYFILSRDDAKKVIRISPKGEYSTGYFIALLQKKQ